MKTSKLVTLFVVVAMLLSSIAIVSAEAPQPVRGDYNLTAMAGCDPDVRVWRLRNQSDVAESFSLTVAGHGVQASGSVPANTDLMVEVPDFGGANTAVLSIAGFSYTKAHSNALLPESECTPPEEPGDGGNSDEGPVWVPSGVESQSMRVTNPAWLELAARGELMYAVYWVNEYGAETLIEECEAPVSFFGDISCVLAPGTTPEPFVLYTYVYSTNPDMPLYGLVQVNWVQNDVASYVEYDTTNLGPRELGGFEYAPIPADFFVS